MDSVLIMMATYDGEKYIREQIDSIQNQSYTNWHLLIQDDGSGDKTVEYISEYCKNDPRIELVHNESDKHGAYINFHTLANKAKHMEKYDYYMFCDQDDIWLPEKISTYVNFFKKLKNSDEPILCYADMQMIDRDGNITLKSLNSVRGLAYVNPYRVFFAHRIAGCNLFMNRILFEMVPEVDVTLPYVNILSHDNYYAKFAAVFGEIYYIDQPLMQYRRHGENCTGDAAYGKFSIRKIFKRIINLDKLAKDHAITYNQSLVTIGIMRKLIESPPTIVDEVENVIRTGGIRSVRFLRSKNISWGNKTNDLSRYIVMSLGRYKKYLIQ